MSISIQPQPSAMLRAIDLVRVNVDAMNPEDLEEHDAQVADAIAALNDYLNSPSHKSASALRNALYRLRRLCAHRARVRDLLMAHKAAAALSKAAQAGSAAAGSPASQPFRI